MSQQPLVTVILPVYNGARYLQKALESLVSQTYSNLEILLLNDASTDNSVEIAESFKDVRIKIVHNEHNLGIVDTLNKGIRLANGSFIARMDADDICRPERIEKQVNILKTRPDVAMVDTIMEYIDEEGHPLGRNNSSKVSVEQIKSTLPFTNCLGHSSVMLRKEIYTRYPYRRIVYEDYDLWLRLINDNRIIYKINEVLLLYRIHTASIMGKEGFKRRLSMANTKLFYYRSLRSKDKLKGLNLKLLGSALFNYVHGYLKKLIFSI